MDISDFELKIEWPNKVNKDIVYGQLTPYILSPSTEFDHKAFYHQVALAKPVPPKPINFTFDLYQNADIYNYLKSFFKSKKYYGLYSLKNKGWIYINDRMMYSRNKKILKKRYTALVNAALFPRYFYDNNIVIKPFWL